MRPYAPELYNSNKRTEKPIPLCDITDSASQVETLANRNVRPSGSTNIPVRTKTSTNRPKQPMSTVRMVKSKLSKTAGVTHQRPSLNINRRFGAFSKMKYRSRPKAVKKYQTGFIETENEFNAMRPSIIFAITRTRIISIVT